MVNHERFFHFSIDGNRTWVTLWRWPHIVLNGRFLLVTWNPSVFGMHWKKLKIKMPISSNVISHIKLTLQYVCYYNVYIIKNPMHLLENSWHISFKNNKIYDLTTTKFMILTDLCFLCCSSPYFCISLTTSFSFWTSLWWVDANLSVALLMTCQNGANVLKNKNKNKMWLFVLLQCVTI